MKSNFLPLWSSISISVNFSDKPNSVEAVFSLKKKIMLKNENENENKMVQLFHASIFKFLTILQVIPIQI